MWPSTSPAPAIFTPNSGNRSMCSLSHKAPASSFSLLNQDSFQAQTHIPPLPLTNQVFPHSKSISFFEVMTIPSSKYLGFSGGTNGKEPTCQCRIKTRVQSLVTKILWRAWQPLQYSCMENPTDRGASRVTVHGVRKKYLEYYWCTVSVNQIYFILK